MVDMTTMGERLKEERIAQGKTQEYLGRVAGVSKQAIGKIESGGTREPATSTLDPVARDLNVNLRWLMSGKGPKRGAASPALVSSGETRPGYIRFHVMGEGGAGPGMINTDYPEVLREVELAEWQVRDQLGSLVSPQRVKLLTVRGDSMAPRIRSGDVVFVDIEDRVYDGDGNYVVVLHGHTLVKRLELRTDGLHIVSLADATRPDIVPPADMPSLQIAGRVLGAIQFRRAEEL